MQHPDKFHPLHYQLADDNIQYINPDTQITLVAALYYFKYEIFPLCFKRHDIPLFQNQELLEKTKKHHSKTTMFFLLLILLTVLRPFYY